MIVVKDVLEVLNDLAPWSQALPGDKVGLQVGDPHAEVSHAFVGLDRSLGLIDLAASVGAQLIVTHHPLIWDPVQSIIVTDNFGTSVQRLIKNDLSLIAAHTNWDVAPGGITEALAARLGLIELIPFGRSAPNSPWPLGRIGVLSEPMKLSEFVQLVDDRLLTKTLSWGDPDQWVQRIGLVGGAAGSEWRAAAALGADAFITGEVAQHDALSASASGLAVLCSGHYATEQPGCEALRDALSARLPSVAWTLYEPKQGFDGRPF